MSTRNSCLSARRLTNASVMVLGASAVALRFLAPDRLLRGLSRGRATAGLGAAASGIKFLETSVLAIRREVPRGRILLPGLVFVELVRISAGHTLRAELIAAVVIFELGLVAFASAQLRSVHRVDRFLEEYFDEVFRQFLPDRVSAFASREVVLLWEGLRWMARGFRNPPIAGFSYAQESVARYLPVLIPLTSMGDEIVIGILLRNQALWMRLAVIAIDIWAIFLAFGLFATFHGRPHQATAKRVELRCGVFGRCEFDPNLLLDAVPTGDVESRHKNVGRLTVKGTPVLRISLRQPVLVHHSFRNRQACDTLLVCADDPQRFSQALKQAAAEARSRES